MVVLRPMQDRDIDAVVAACQDPEIPRWTTVPSPYRREHALSWHMVQDAKRRAGEAIFLIVADAQTDVLLGAIDVRVQNADQKRGEIGYWLAPEARGRGAITRAVVLLSRWALNGMGLGRVTVLAHPENEASQRVAERAGFVREGLLRDYALRAGVREDMIMYSLLPRDLERG